MHTLGYHPGRSYAYPRAKRKTLETRREPDWMETGAHDSGTALGCTREDRAEALGTVPTCAMLSSDSMACGGSDKHRDLSCGERCAAHRRQIAVVGDIEGSDTGRECGSINMTPSPVKGKRNEETGRRIW